MDSRRGKRLTPEAKKLAVSVKHYFDQAEIEPYEPSVNRTADALGISVATVKRIMADYNRDPSLLDEPATKRGRPVYAVNISHLEAIRTYVVSKKQPNHTWYQQDLALSVMKALPAVWYVTRLALSQGKPIVCFMLLLRVEYLLMSS